MTVKTLEPDVQVRTSVQGAALQAQAPVALSPSIDRWTAARLLRRAAGPLSLRDAAVEAALEPARLKAVLVPAWSLDVEVRSKWSCGEEHSGTRTLRCAGLVVPGVEGPNAAVIGAALASSEPATELSASDLSEWSPLGVSRPLAAAWAAACAHLAATAAEDAALGLSLDETERLSVETRFENGEARALLVPAWRASLDLGESQAAVLVEACGGRVIGRFPWNGRRLAALAAGAGALLGALWVALL